MNFGTATDFSISFWAKFSTWTFDPPFVGNKDWLSGNNKGWMIATGTDGRLQWNFGGAPGLRKDYDGPAGTVSNGAWHHVAVTFLRAGEVITYLDGREVDIRDITASLNNVDTSPGLATNLGQDGTGRSNHGTSRGEPTLMEGKVGGKALRFATKADGSSINYVTLGSPADLDFGTDADYSFSFWLKFSQWTRDPVLIANKSWFSSGSLIGYALAIGSDGRFQWNFKEQVGERADYDSPPGLISDGRWHHVVVTFDRQGMGRSYLDGQQVNEASLIPDLDSIDTPAGLATNIVQDGKGSYTDNGAVGMTDGQLDDVAIWRRVLLAAEVATLYQQGLQGIDVLGQAPPPVLQIARNGLTLTLTWPGSVTGFTLESSAALGAAADWTPVPGVSGNAGTPPPSRRPGTPTGNSCSRSWIPTTRTGNAAGTWRVTTHGSILQTANYSTPTTGTDTLPKADGDGSILLAPAIPSPNQALAFTFAFHPLDDDGMVD